MKVLEFVRIEERGILDGVAMNASGNDDAADTPVTIVGRGSVCVWDGG